MSNSDNTRRVTASNNEIRFKEHVVHMVNVAIENLNQDIEQDLNIIATYVNNAPNFSATMTLDSTFVFDGIFYNKGEKVMLIYCGDEFFMAIYKDKINRKTTKYVVDDSLLTQEEIKEKYKYQ